MLTGGAQPAPAAYLPPALFPSTSSVTIGAIFVAWSFVAIEARSPTMTIAR